MIKITSEETKQNNFYDDTEFVTDITLRANNQSFMHIHFRSFDNMYDELDFNVEIQIYWHAMLKYLSK